MVQPRALTQCGHHWPLGLPNSGMVNSLQQSVQVPQRLDSVTGGAISIHYPREMILLILVCCGQLDGAILKIATHAIEHGVSYIIFVFLILPSLDAVLHVGRAAGLWRAIRRLHAR